ncbi:MAG TPA: AsmA-like C-terminal region-containing protein, partial [Armatimonadota bacterium]|nr:AsmA-like C-terminal region-containing protein [Armatimonadota bacterium]
VRLAPRDGETAPPLVADRIRVYLSWWDLLLHRRLRVTELFADGARLHFDYDLRRPARETVDLARQFQALSDLGLRRVGLENSQVDVTTILASGARQEVTTAGVDFLAELKGDRFSYRLRADQWSGLGLMAQNLRLAGDASSGGLTIRQSSVQFRGGRLLASGQFVASEGTVGLQVRVRDLPLSELAAQFDIPKEWAVGGKLTGAIDLNATSGALRRVQGRLAVAPGSVSHSRATLPWRTATADLVWTPEHASLRNIDVQGDGIRLRGAADARGRPGLPLARRPFQAIARVDATNTENVAALAQLLTFRTPVPGRWNVGNARIDFDATGIVGDLRSAHAIGHFQAKGAALQLRPAGTALVLNSVEGDLDRQEDRLEIRNLRASAEGLTAHGNATIVPAAGSRSGRFAVNGQVDLTNWLTLRQQLPQLPLWQYVAPATSRSTGRLTLAVAGPTQAPERATGSGGFRFREFAASVPLGTGSQRWRVPVRELTGRLRLANNRLAVREIALRSDLFTGSGAVTAADVTGSPHLAGEFRMVSDRWAELPPVRDRVPKGLSGGRLMLALQLPEGAGTSPAPLEGALELRGATYRALLSGKQHTLPLQVASADFRYLDGRVRVPDYKLVTPFFRTSGSANARQAGGGWRVQATGRLDSGDAGALLRWGAGPEVLHGGTLTASYTASVPPAGIDAVSVSGRAKLVNARPALPPGTLPFAPEELAIQALTGAFTYQDGALRFQDAEWRGRRFRAAGDGTLARGRLAGQFSLTTGEWKTIAGDLARTLPVEGGQLTVHARVNG